MHASERTLVQELAALAGQSLDLGPPDADDEGLAEQPSEIAPEPPQQQQQPPQQQQSAPQPAAALGASPPKRGWAGVPNVIAGSCSSWQLLFRKKAFHLACKARLSWHWQAHIAQGCVACPS